MPTSNANATWEGGLPGGKGTFQGETQTISGSYTFGTRFTEEKGSNPEELLAAAHAACFSMALAGQLQRAGTPPERVHTEAACTVEKVGDGFQITTMRLKTRAKVPDVEPDAFRKAAEAAKEGCPVSKALAGVKIELDATLE